MPLVNFIKLFDKTALENKHVSFAIHAGLDRGGKWVFWCDNKSKDDLIKWIEENECLNDLEIDGFNKVELSPEDEDSIRIIIHFD